jgi:predicted amidohydrolase
MDKSARVKQKCIFTILVVSFFYSLFSYSDTNRIHVASIQMQTYAGQEHHNLAKAELYVREAVGRGAKLVVLPEFFHWGYTFELRGRQGCQSRDGDAGSFLRRMARENQIWIAGTIYEKIDDGCFNTFLLVGPGGPEEGQEYEHRKTVVPALEGYFFEPSNDRFVVETPIGRIGLVICAESMENRLLQQVVQERPDFILIAYSAPGSVPKVARVLGGPPEDVIYEISKKWAKTAGVPVITSSVVGEWKTGVPFVPFWKFSSFFWGHSGVFQADGNILSGLIKGEGVADAEIELAEPNPSLSISPDIDQDGVELPRLYKWLMKPKKVAMNSYRKWVESWD